MASYPTTMTSPETATFSGRRTEDRWAPTRGPASDLDRPARRRASPALAATLHLLPLPAALTNADGDLLGANAKLWDVLGLKHGIGGSAVHLPFPDDWIGALAGQPQDVQAGNVWVERRDGLVELQVMVVSVGGPGGCLLYLVTDYDHPPIERSPPEDDHISPLASLTEREAQVLHLLMSGGSNKSVARGLGISPRTVEVHRGRVLKKLDAKSLSQAIIIALANGFEAGPPPGAHAPFPGRNTR